MASRSAFGRRALLGLVFTGAVLPAVAAELPGAIPAVFRVGDQGDANYTIPIATVAGTGGLRPQLALSYNHLGGNGLAGMRWTLSGISAISRCPRTFAQDGVADAVTNTASDRFCLEGQTLVNVSGPYGGTNTEYRTEIETFRRVVQLGSQGGGPQSFRVDFPNGVSSYYGTTEDARVGTPGNVVRKWFISYSTDQFGNRINYSYNENDTTGETLPSEIAWTQNAATPTPPYKVTIVYEPRPIDDRRFPFDAGGAPWQQTQRIDQIQVTRNGQTINTYHLNYHNPTATGTGRSQLASVQVCGPTDCLPSTSLSVQNGVRSWGALVNTTRATGSHPLVGDQNGDGKMDLFVSLSGTWQVYHGNNGALGLDPAVDSLVSSATNPDRARVIDYNGDGRADLLFQSGSVWHVLQSVAGSTPFSLVNTGISTTPFSHANVRDFDGDGLEDWIHQGGFGLQWMRNTGSGFAGVQTIGSGIHSYGNFVNLRAPDLNGDGRAELFAVDGSCEPGPNGWEVCTGEHAILMASGSSYSAGMYLGIGTYSNPRAIDMNGDGLDDLLYVAGTTWRRRLSLGSEADTQIPATNADKVIIADYDNDGREDLLRPEGDYWLIHRASSALLSAAYTESVYSPGAGAAGGFVADINGDGFPEIVRGSGGTWHVHRHNSALPDVVTTFTNGLGYAVNVTHESLSNSSNYSQTTPLNYYAPGTAAYIHPYRGSRHVVVAENHDNGIGGTRPFVHYYDSAYVDVSGRDWFSFNYHRVDDVAGGTYSTTYLVRVWPYVSYPVPDHAQLHRASDGQLIRKVDFHLGEVINTLPTPDVHFVRVEKLTTWEYEVGGIADGQHLRTIVDDPVHDATYGYVTSRTTTVTDPVTAETWTSTTNFNATVDLDDWCLGQPGLVETTNTSPIGSATRKVRHVWNPNDCSLSETTDESEIVGAKQLKTTFTYDGYGNPDLISQDSVDGSAQNRSTDFVFDAVGQYPTSVTVGTVNLTTTFTWDYLSGQRASVAGPDGLVTSWQYDEFGRLAQEIRPVGSTTITYSACTSCWPYTAVYFARAQGTDGSDDKEFFDELGRVVGKSWTMPLGNEGRQVTRYNATGRVAAISRPFGWTEPDFETRYFYDVIGRVTSEDAPVSDVMPSGATTIYDYRGHDLWITDAENNTTKYTHNAARQIKQVVDAMNGTTAYTYKPFGELATVQDAEFHTTTIGYDARGFKTSLVDPNMGTWAYDTNVYGELTDQRSPVTVAPTWTQTLTYDAAGRIKTRCDVPEGASATTCGTDDTATWTYYLGTAAVQANRGKLDTISGPQNAKKFTYGLPHGLPTQVRHTVFGSFHFYDLTYDSEGRLDVLTYPTSTSSYRFKVDYDYDSWGHLDKVKDGNTPSLVYYRLYDADALGRERIVALGNGLMEYRYYDGGTGNLEDIETDNGLGSSIQNLSFTYDEVGNVLTRTNANIGKTETFTYDALNRLSTMQVSGLSAVTMAYSAGGRITSRSDVGSYTYTGGCGGGPMAVKSAAGKTYCYDAAGRMTHRNSNEIQWFSYDAPKWIYNGTMSSTFTYGVDRKRIRQIRKTGSTTTATILYLGDLLERDTEGGTTTWRHYVRARESVVAQVNRVDTTNTVEYLHRDLQDSVVEVTNASGTIVQSLAYDAWGLRRDPSTWAPLPSPFGGTQPTKRGYTGHEHLDNIQLVHMNGRVQDPRLGLFISADPFVQAPYYSQSLNRYSYVWNNPLTLVDPSGFQPEDEAPPLLFLPPPSAGLPVINSDTGLTPEFEQLLREGYIARGPGTVLEPPGTVHLSASPSPGGSEHGACAGGNGPCHSPPQQHNLPDIDPHEVAIWVMPGYDLGTCMSSRGDCSPVEWGVGVIGVIPGGKGAAAGTKAVVKVAGEVVEKALSKADDAARALEHTPDQRALKELVEEASNGGRKALSAADAETILDWADEVRYPGARASPGDLATPSNWASNPVPHIHIPGAGRGSHVPVEPGVKPRTP